MSRALVVVNLEIAGEPEPLVNAVDHFETAIRNHFAPYVVVNKCSVSAKNTFSRPDASESGPVMASPTEGHGSSIPACAKCGEGTTYSLRTQTEPWTISCGVCDVFICEWPRQNVSKLERSRYPYLQCLFIGHIWWPGRFPEVCVRCGKTR